MSKITPGPWKAHDTSYETGGSDSYRVSRFYIQARGWKRGNTFEYPHICAVSRIEDAHLIAAAPELLAACEEALDWLENHAYDESDPGVMGLIEMLEAAISKAK